MGSRTAQMSPSPEESPPSIQHAEEVHEVEVRLDAEMRVATDHVAERGEELQEERGTVGFRRRPDASDDLTRESVERLVRERGGPVPYLGGRHKRH
jgi:hypothetical protein